MIGGCFNTCQEAFDAHFYVRQMPLAFVGKREYDVDKELRRKKKSYDSKRRMGTKKLLASLMTIAMLAGISTFSAFAATPNDPAGLQQLGDKYGFTVEYVGEREGLPVYKTTDLERLEEVLKYEAISTRDACNHDWFYIWTTETESCIRNPRNHHTRAVKLEKCNKCGLVMNTGEWEIWDCPSGCKKSDY